MFGLRPRKMASTGRDYGVVLKSEGFKNNRVWKPYVARVGDKFILNHGAFTDQGTNNNLLRFYESPDLIHWKYLYEIPIDTNFYRSNGRWDHMYTIPKNDQNPSQGSWGYMVADPIDHGGFRHDGFARRHSLHTHQGS